MRLIIKSGDILDEAVDVLVSTANVTLDLSGGIGGAIFRRGGSDVQQELMRYLRGIGMEEVAPGTIVRTGCGPLRVKHILHAVAIDGSCRSDVGLVRQVIESVLAEAARLGAGTVALPALATGYGPLSISAFADALRGACSRSDAPIEELRVVVREEGEAEVVAASLGVEPRREVCSGDA